jgi:ferric-dicitrate binding protein FerR (iron transport regulator)
MDIPIVYMRIDRFWDLLSKKISAEASQAELKELEEILIDHPHWKNTADALEILGHQSTSFENNNDAEQAFERHIERIKKADIEFNESYPSNNPEAIISNEKNTRRGFRNWGLPAGLLAIITLIFFIFKNNIVSSDNAVKRQSPLSQVTTKPGSKTQIQLPDGSIVWLNASSNLTYDKDFGKTLREVNLTGEAFFDVMKDPSHPFIIHTKVIDVKVLGTQFNVKAYPNDSYTETSLIRGSVEVTVKNRPNEKHYLKPNEKVSVANNILNESEPAVQTITRSKPFILTQPLTYYHVDSTLIETSWVENKLIFQENETFREVALKMERWYGINMNFADEEIGSYHIYGSFTNETITQALDALREGFRFHYKITGNNIIITK